MPFRLLVPLGLLCSLLPLHQGAPGPDGTGPDPAYYRERVKAMFYHAYDSYLENAFPYDELRPLTCDGHDTWGRFWGMFQNSKEWLKCSRTTWTLILM